ncbi:glycosyltransferase [Rhodopila sp.]|uniref:glycosyltransferase n=1 Tax=Rhodopila sp. TaxID=2480087 RepID=UPI003D0DCC05
MMSQTISVLMAAYQQQRPEHFARALESIFAQVQPVQQLVLTLTGRSGPEQEAIVARYAVDPRINDVRVLRLARTVDLPEALNIGLNACTGTWIMCMDSADESLPDRSAVQLDYVRQHPVDLVGGWTEEVLEGKPARVLATPTTHEAIVKALAWRNILAHAGMLVRADTLRAAGGYRSNYPPLADWDLWVRLALANARFAVIPKVLVRMLTGTEQRSQRRGLRYLQHEVRFRTYCWMRGFSSFRQYAFSTATYATFRLAGAVSVHRLKSRTMAWR